MKCFFAAMLCGAVASPLPSFTLIPSSTPEGGQWTALIAVTAAVVPPGEIAAPDANKYDCPRCKDTGVIVHGDGHTTPCPDCTEGDLPTGILQLPGSVQKAADEAFKLAQQSNEILADARRQGYLEVRIMLPGDRRIAEVPSSQPVARQPVFRRTAPATVQIPTSKPVQATRVYYSPPRGVWFGRWWAGSRGRVSYTTTRGAVSCQNGVCRIR